MTFVTIANLQQACAIVSDGGCCKCVGSPGIFKKNTCDLTEANVLQIYATLRGMKSDSIVEEELTHLCALREELFRGLDAIREEKAHVSASKTDVSGHFETAHDREASESSAVRRQEQMYSKKFCAKNPVGEFDNITSEHDPAKGSAGGDATQTSQRVAEMLRGNVASAEWSTWGNTDRTQNENRGADMLEEVAVSVQESNDAGGRSAIRELMMSLVKMGLKPDPVPPHKDSVFLALMKGLHGAGLRPQGYDFEKGDVMGSRKQFPIAAKRARFELMRLLSSKVCVNQYVTGKGGGRCEEDEGRGLQGAMPSAHVGRSNHKIGLKTNFAPKEIRIIFLIESQLFHLCNCLDMVYRSPSNLVQVFFLGDGCLSCATSHSHSERVWK